MVDKFLLYLRTKPMALSISPSPFSAAETTALMGAGFLTSSIQGLSSVGSFSNSDTRSPGTSTSISSISKAASGSMAAIGGEGAINGAGGRAGIRRSSSQLEKTSWQESLEKFGEGVELKFSLPGTGIYLKVRYFLCIFMPVQKSSLNYKTCSGISALSPSKQLQRLSCHRFIFWKNANHKMSDSF